MMTNAPALTLAVALALAGCEEASRTPRAQRPAPSADAAVAPPDDLGAPTDDMSAPEDLAPPSDLGGDLGGDLGAPLEAAGDPALAAYGGGCYALRVEVEGAARWLGGGAAPALVSAAAEARPLFLQPTDLGEYLLYDPQGRYLASEAGASEEGASEGAALEWQETLADTPPLRDPSGALQPRPYSSGEWALQRPAEGAAGRALLVHQRARAALALAPGGGGRLTLTPRAGEALAITLEPAEGCAPHPELSLDAEGEVTKSRFDDGDLFGVVDAHSHLFAHLGFGSGVHGAPFHRLGVARALESCEEAHGEEGRLDVWGYFADRGEEVELAALTPTLASGRAPTFNHNTDGYPSFTDWPNAPYSATHQTQYYRWLERAWRGGLRLVVQHAVANQVICELQRARHPLAARYECNEMINVKRSVEETYALERYIDAQAGGEGRGFLRVVRSPAEARAVIGAGKLAVVLGVETSNLFDCYAAVTPERPRCTPEEVTARLDELHALGVRVLFPVHKYDNGFSAGDGARGVLEIANLINTGHWSSYVDDCDLDAPDLFDHGPVAFGGLNRPREDLGAPPVFDMSGFARNPVGALLPVLSALSAGPLEGEHCRNHGLTDLGRHLIDQMMSRGMLIEMDHFSRRSYEEVLHTLEERDYPALGTHGHHFNGRIYALGGSSKLNPDRCQRGGDPSSMIRSLRERVALREGVGAYPAEGFGFDLNGFAGYPKPRFGARAECAEEQTLRVTYPFTSYAGDVTFTPPRIGARALDFNEEGLAHVGLLPELIEDMRQGGLNDEGLEPLFRSAEGYVRTWERAERRARELRP